MSTKQEIIHRVIDLVALLTLASACALAVASAAV